VAYVTTCGEELFDGHITRSDGSPQVSIGTVSGDVGGCHWLEDIFA